MKRIVIVSCIAAALLTASPARAEVKTEVVSYKYNDTTLKGYLAYDDAIKGKRPGVLVVHEWWGLNDDARKRARQLAALGYVAFAADMYGDGKTTEHPKEAGQMAGEVRKNMDVWLGRAKAGLEILQKNDRVDGAKLAAIGYCFGGSTSLQLAYSGAPLGAVVSFHGALPVPSAEQAKAIKSRILICHGAEDTFIPEATIQQVRGAFEKAGTDYQMVYYGRAKHSFTVVGVDKVGVPGLAYQADADRRSWRAMRELFGEAFGEAK